MGYEEATLLFADPGFVRGLGRVVDLGATRNVYNDSESPESADFRAIQSDWASVGEDILDSVRSFEAGTR